MRGDTRKKTATKKSEKKSTSKAARTAVKKVAKKNTSSRKTASAPPAKRSPLLNTDPATLKALAFDATMQALVVTDAKGKVIFVNDAFKQITGYNKKEILNKTPEKLCSEMQINLCKGVAKDVKRHGFWNGEIWGVKKNGESFPVWLTISSLMTDGKVTGYSGMFFDISTLKKNEERLEYMAHYDMLTNLPNRTLLYDRLKQALVQAKRYNYSVAVMLLDLDRFKDVNDFMGHHVGDQLLVEAAERLVNCVRESDTVARMGGDEFIVILPEIREARNAAQMGQKFLDALAQPFVLEGHEVFTSGSIGITIYPYDSTDLNMLIKHADTAMYHAKAQGKNNFKFFTEDINKSTVERFLLESNFRRALEKLEFQLNYQPKVDLRTGEIVGMEALLRWYHPDQGNVNPGLFIPLAEETGLVVQLGEWVIKEACRQNKEWQEMGLPPLKIAVNLSPRHFHGKNLIEMISEILEETKIAPEYLMLEITERTLIENVEDTISTLNSLRDMGVGVSVDDFGTGYSSLNYLKKFQVDELKIDQSFVMDLGQSSDSRKVINAIIALAHSLNLQVVAEGVETKEQLDFLLQNDCDEVQGYYFSKPLTAENFRAKISKGLSVDIVS